MELKQLDEILARVKVIQDEWHRRVIRDRGEDTECRRNSVEELAGFVNRLAAAMTQDRAEHNRVMRAMSKESDTLRQQVAALSNTCHELRIQLAVPRESRKIEAQKAEIKRLTEVVDHWRKRCLRSELGHASQDTINCELESRKNKAEARVGELEKERNEWRLRAEEGRELIQGIQNFPFRKEYEEASAERYRLSNEVDVLKEKLGNWQKEITEVRQHEASKHYKTIDQLNARLKEQCGRVDSLTVQLRETRDALDKATGCPFPQPSVLDKLRNDVLSAAKGAETLAAVQAMLAFGREEKPEAEADPVKRVVTVSILTSLGVNTPAVLDSAIGGGGVHWMMTDEKSTPFGRLYEFTSP